jgi:hypothetical protein
MMLKTATSKLNAVHCIDLLELQAALTWLPYYERRRNGEVPSIHIIKSSRRGRFFRRLFQVQVYWHLSVHPPLLALVLDLLPHLPHFHPLLHLPHQRRPSKGRRAEDYNFPIVEVMMMGISQVLDHVSNRKAATRK